MNRNKANRNEKQNKAIDNMASTNNIDTIKTTISDGNKTKGK